MAKSFKVLLPLLLILLPLGAQESAAPVFPEQTLEVPEETPVVAEETPARVLELPALAAPETPATLAEAAALGSEHFQGRPLRRRIFPPTQRFTPPPPTVPAGDRAAPIPGLDQPLTQRYLRQYSSPAGLAWLKEVMERARPYLGFVREEIAERGLPAELLYLPVIESGYLPTAVSRSGAAGLWQFMRNSMTPFNMRVDDWLDERMDFWKSTQGALRKLEENYQALGNWPMALAAYNAGLGGIRQVSRRAGSDDYWKLSEQKALRTETIHYVPKLLAVAEILCQPRKYGLDLWQESPEWVRVPVEKIVDLDMVAREAGIEEALLRQGNRELLYNTSPPAAGYLLKVPAESAAQVEEVLKRGGLELVRNYYHTIRYGDTLSALALHYGVTVALIEGANPGIRSTALRIGSRLKIPALKEAAPYTRNNGPPSESFTGSYLVRKGDTLWSIALAHDTDPMDLAQVNNMDINGILREGRTLKVPIR
ncbi:MAG: LysM peptidoglycan-binding domain-containing protein [Treponema sp.]|jgi:membrane-bound lytic murein transglycosylase D|nr:LysM peptidoglycan-binding domain-containing protein [Treponema sp.]